MTISLYYKTKENEAKSLSLDSVISNRRVSLYILAMFSCTNIDIKNYTAQFSPFSFTRTLISEH